MQLADYRATRRELVGAAAAASVLGPSALARARGLPQASAPNVFEYRLGTLTGSSTEIATAWPFVLAGVEWSGPQAAGIELRARAVGDRWSPWTRACTLGHDADGAPATRDRLFGEPVWFGVADRFQVRVSEPVSGLTVHFVSARRAFAGGRGSSGAAVPWRTRDFASAAGGFPLARPILDAGPGQPPIIARAAWAGNDAPPAVPPTYGAVRLAFVHHTVNPNGYSAAEVPAMLFSIYQYHRFVRGFHDIGYNFLVDLYGRIWEAREGGIDQAVIGAQAGGYNVESTGVAVLGTFSYVVPSPAAISAAEHLLAWKLSLHGRPSVGEVTVEVDPSDAFYTPFAPGAHVSLPRIAGHRQGCTTDCPGEAFFARLPSMRPEVARLAGEPARLTFAAALESRASYLMLANATAVAGVPIAVSGRLSRLSGDALAGAPIEIQRLASGGSQTIAVATTATDGTWDAELSLEHSALVRALHRPKPASASPLVAIEVRRAP